jgi:hypothetical protein
MGNIPILKPREVVALLEALGLAKFGSGARTNSFATLMGDSQPFHFMLDVMCRQFCFAKSQKILA